MNMLNQKGISTTAILLIVGIIIIAGGLVWWGVSRNYDTNQNNNNNSNTNTATNSNQNTNINITTDPVTGWNIYTNDKYGYRLQYPTEWELIQNKNDDEFDSVTFAIQTSFIRNYYNSINEYHPKKGEISVNIYIYKIAGLNFGEWYEEYKKVYRNDIYENVDIEKTIINDKDAVIEKITTGRTPSIPVDTEWLNGKITNYFINNNQQVLELSAIVWLGDEYLLDIADKIAQSLTFIE